MRTHKTRVAVIGGGIAGLTAAYRLQQWAGDTVEWRLIERDSRLGGKIMTAREDGFLIEAGPDSFHAQKPAATELCQELGLAGELIGPSVISGSTLIWSNGRLRAMPDAMSLVPSRMGPFLRSSLISWPGKVRMGMEAFIPARRGEDDESIAAFVRRRLGNEAVTKIASPLMAGIHAGDAERLSLKSTFPRFHEIEREYGGLVRAMWALRAKPKPPTPAPPYVTLKGGLQQMVDALAAALDPTCVSLGRQILSIRRASGGYRIFIDGEQPVLADAIVFATPASVTAYLIDDIAPQLAAKLREIRYVSTATVSLAFRRHDLPVLPAGSGYVVSESERRGVLGCTWSSNKFEGRAPEGCVLLRIFIGGIRAENLAEQSDQGLLLRARREVYRSLHVTAQPVLTKVYHWPKAHSQYEVGHQERVAHIEHLAAQEPRMYLAGAAYHGVGIPDCIQSANRVAQRIVRATQRRAVANNVEFAEETL